MLVRLNIILISSFLMFNICWAQSDAQVLLKNIQDKFDSITDLSANITQSVGGQVNLKGKVYYQKDDHLRMEFKNNVIVSDGETAWNYNQKQNKVIITNFESEGNRDISIKQLVYEYPKNCQISSYELEGEKVLKLIPEDDTFNFSSVELFINEDNLIAKALIDDPMTGTIAVEFSDYKLNQNLADSFFIFSPPEGSQVIDLR